MTDNQRLIVLCGLLSLINLSSRIVSANYLKEKPASLTPCRLHEKPQNSTCFSQALETIFKNWKNGELGSDLKASIDPFRVKRVRLSQSTDIIDVKLELRNMTTYGLSTVKAIRTTIDEKNYTIVMQLHLPHMNFVSDYRIKGNIFRLNLNAQGQLTTETTGLNYTCTVKTKLIQHDNEYFLNVTSFKINVQNVDNYHVNFTNLFGGQRELEESANDLFNLSWREFFTVMLPTVEQTFDVILADRYRKLLNYIPARFIIADLP